MFGQSWSEDEFANLLANPAVSAWLMQEGKWQVGYVCFSRLEREAEIYRIGVAPNFRGQGYGRWLLGQYLDWAKKRGIARVFLEVREGNTPAVHLYEAAGFRVAARREQYFAAPPEDALIMECRLPVKLRRVPQWPVVQQGPVRRS